MKSVAEDVENRGAWDFLRSLGCDVAQGYYIARPIASIDVTNWRAGRELARRVDEYRMMSGARCIVVATDVVGDTRLVGELLIRQCPWQALLR